MPPAAAAAAPPAKSVARSAGRVTSISATSRSRGRRAAAPVLAQGLGLASAHLARIAAHLVLGRACGVQQLLERPVAPQQLGGRLRADPRRARQAVGRIAAQGDEVRDQIRRDAVALDDLLGTEQADGAAFAGLDERHALAHSAVEVAVACQEQRPPTRRGLCGSKGEHDVVGLEGVGVGDVPAHRLQRARARAPTAPAAPAAWGRGARGRRGRASRGIRPPRRRCRRRPRAAAR